MFWDVFNSVIIYILIPIGTAVFSWWLYKETIKYVKPETIREKQKTIIAWLIFVLPLFSITILGILDNLKVIELGSFIGLVVVATIFIIFADYSWIYSIQRSIQKINKKG
jgi:drug/metabolite transporter (DMT)-like permease